MHHQPLRRAFRFSELPRRQAPVVVPLWLLLLLTALLGCETPAGAEPDADADAGGDVALTDVPADVATDTAADVADPTADPWANEATGATAAYQLSDKGWHDQPFPTDVRRDPATGVLDLQGFTPPRDGDMPGILQQYLDHAGEHLRGFSLQPTIYVRFDQPLATKTLPKPAGTLSQSLLFLMDVDPASPEYGQLIPVRSQASGALRAQQLLPNLLAVQPIWGRPLRPTTTYAFVLRRGWRDAAGKVLGQPPVLRQVLETLLQLGTPAALDAQGQKLATALQPLAAAVQAGKIKLPYRDIAAATVFTTGNPAGQLGAMAEWVRNKAQTKAVANWQKVSASHPDYTLITATYTAPNFQKGIPPYDDEGSGGFEFDAQGQPIVQREEQLRVAIAVPKVRPLDVAGKPPVVLSAHGTGGSYLSFAEGGKIQIGTELAARGMVIVSIDQPLHGPRTDPPISGSNLDLKTFNFLNISAGRSGFRQSALDTVFLARMVREGLLDVPEEVGPNGLGVELDGERVAFIGHSQGGLSGALAAAIEPSLKGYVLSGAGAGLSLTIMLRKDPADISKTLETVLGLDKGELDEFHPAVSLVQMLSDITDPLSYGRLVFAREPGVRPPHVLLTEGLLDAATPSATAEALASAIGLDVLAPAVHLNDVMLLAETPVLTGPVSGNLQHNGFAVTGVVSQWENLDHFVIFKSQSAAGLYAKFLQTTLDTGDAVADLP